MTATLRLVLLLLCFAIPAVSAGAQEMPKSLACSFTAGSSLSYADSVYTSTPVKPLAFDITDIDLDGQRATLLTGGGKGTLRIVRAINANHFLEVVTEGFLNITTIYDVDPRRGAYPAVHSRHFGLFGEPLVAQYQGFCTAK